MGSPTLLLFHENFQQPLCKERTKPLKWLKWKIGLLIEGTTGTMTHHQGLV